MQVKPMIPTKPNMLRGVNSIETDHTDDFLQILSAFWSKVLRSRSTSALLRTLTGYKKAHYLE